MTKQSFNRNFIFAVIILLIIGVAGYFIWNNYLVQEQEGPFTLKTSLINSVVPAGGKSLHNIVIQNNEDEYKTYLVYFEGLKGIGTLSHNAFTLGPGESKDIDIMFKDPQIRVGIFLGKLVVNDTVSVQKIPVAITFSHPESQFGILTDSIPKYRNVYPGGNLGLDILISDLKSEGVDKNVLIRYSLRSFDNQLIFFDSDTILIKDEISFSKVFPISDILPKEDYLFITEVLYNETYSFGTQLIEVEDKKQIILPEFFAMIMVGVLLFLLVVVILFFFFIKTRDDLVIELRRQQKLELRRNVQLFTLSRQEIKNIPDKVVREQKLRELNGLEKRIVTKLTSKQDTQIRELKRLSKLGKQGEMKRKMDSWRDHGYKMVESKTAVKRIKHLGINSKIKEWEMQGFDVEVLRKKAKIARKKLKRKK